jgi:hypothetical protein
MAAAGCRAARGGEETRRGEVVAALLSLSLLLRASALARDAMSGRRGADWSRLLAFAGSLELKRVSRRRGVGVGVAGRRTRGRPGAVGRSRRRAGLGWAFPTRPAFAYFSSGSTA